MRTFPPQIVYGVPNAIGGPLTFQGGAMVTIYRDAAGTVVEANLKLADGTPVPSGRVTVDASGRNPRLRLEDGVFVQPLYAKPDGSTLLTPILSDAEEQLANASAIYVPAVIVQGAGIDKTGATDCTAAIRALITGAASGAHLVFPVGQYKLASTLLIDKTIRFGGETATRTSTDGSDPVAGVEFIYTGTAGDAILVQPVTPAPVGSTNNTRISPHLHNFLVRGNKNVSGAAAGGGVTLDGRASLPACAVSGFVVEDVHISEAKGDGFTITGDVYEGRIVGLNSTHNGGKGVNVGNVLQPGEIEWDDIHTNDNAGDGAYVTGSSTHNVNRWSSSRNGDHGFWAKTIQLVATSLQCESNAGAEIITIEDCVQAVLIGSNIDYTEPGYVGTGIAIKGASQNVLLLAPEFSGTATTWDITTAATTSTTTVMGYRPSAANKVQFAGANDLLLVGSVMTKGTMEFASDAADRTPVRVRAFAGQTADLFYWLVAGGGVGARVTAAGGIRSADDLIARIGAATQTQIGEMGPAGQAGIFIGADCSIYRRAADILRTDDKFIANAGLGVGNSAAATTPGAVVKKIEVFDAGGASLGFIPVYSSIT